MKVPGILAAAVAGLLLLVLGLAAGGQQASAAPPAGGCSVTVSPGARSPASTTLAAAVVQKTATLDANQMSVATVVVAVGKGSGITQRGTAIALMTAMQESSLDPTAVNGRSLGIFQQQGELYAGLDRTNPAAASAAFYRQLVARVPTYNDPAVDMAQAAQTVQRSGAGPSYYAAWEAWATQLAAALYTGAVGGGGGVDCAPGGGSGGIPITITGLLHVQLPPQAGVTGTVTAPTPQVATVIAAALSYVGTPYVFGGGDPSGPTGGITAPGGPVQNTVRGFDCSGLTLFAYGRIGVSLPHSSAAQLASASAVDPFSQAIPGDLIFWGNPVHHVALYLGLINNTPYDVEAPDYQGVVQVSRVATGGDFRDVTVTPW